MMDVATLRHVNRQATRRSESVHIEPAIWNGTREGYRIPYVGERTPRGWKRTERELLFVDTSGFGADNEPALSQRRMFEAMTPGYGYGLVEAGQFQGYLAEFKKR